MTTVDRLENLLATHDSENTITKADITHALRDDTSLTARLLRWKLRNPGRILQVVYMPSDEGGLLLLQSKHYFWRIGADIEVSRNHSRMTPAGAAAELLRLLRRVAFLPI